MNTTRLTLLDIYHPAFREGYQNGRKHYFQQQTILTDKELVACLQSIFVPDEQEKDGEQENDLFYAIGDLVGQMSGSVVPHQPDEDNTRDLQEAFLLNVMQTYGTAGQTLVDSMRQLWTIQDQLAQELDTDTFELMLHRGITKRTNHI